MNPYLKHLQMNGSTFEEILSDNFSELPGQKDDSDKSALRLAAWCRAAASGDWSLFCKRLERDDLTVEKVLARFSTFEIKSKKIPSWIADAEWIIESLETPSPQEQREKWIRIVKDRVPFEEIFLVYAEQAAQHIISKLAFDYKKYFSNSGWLSIQLILLKQISSLTEAVLYKFFIEYLQGQDTSALAKNIDPLGNDLYLKFVEFLQERNLRKLFSEKPVLIRSIAIITRQWIEVNIELLERINSDFCEVTETFLSDSNNFLITDIIGGLSDPHNLGRSVLILEINGLHKLIYKPKDLGLDFQWYGLCSKLNNLRPPIELKAVKTIAKNGYGWTEFIPHTACISDDDFGSFFKRAGSWLSLFHLYSSVDMHFENIIANGSNPVPIDLEMILQATSPENELTQPELLALNEANKVISNSVLSVGMLPAYTRLPNNKILDLGGLNGITESFTVGVWSNINKNGMCWSKEKKSLQEFLNIPHHDGIYAKLGDYLPEFISGFKEYSKFLLEIKNKNGIDFFLNDFKNLKVRKLIRPTRFYSLLMGRLKDHRVMDDGIAWSVQADFVARLADWDNHNDVIWALQKSERDALLCHNIPYFTTFTDRQEINDCNGTIMLSLAATGLDRARNRFMNLSSREIAWQAKVIELSTLTVSNSSKSSLENDYKFDRQVLEFQKLSDPKILFNTCADEMADLIRISSIQSDKSVAWLGMNWLGDFEAAQLMPIGTDLYGGSIGIAIFLAAHYQCSGSKSSYALTYKVVAGIRCLINQKTAARWARNLGVGGASGLGSIIYGLTTLSQLLGDAELLHDAEKIANLITSDLIRADDSLDVIAGSAGAILGLVKLCNVHKSSLALEKAILCGEYLMTKPRFGKLGARSWVINKNSRIPLSGMSHGASGFALAMFSLFEKTQRTDFLDAGKECLNYEQSTFRSKQKNWLDLRISEEQFLCQWCHGSVGIGLARLGINKLWGGYREKMDSDILDAIKVSEQKWPNKSDTLCCGTLGSIEFLKEAGKYLKNKELEELASNRLAGIISTSNINNGFSIFTRELEFNLGFFQGAAGIGYTALRHTNVNLPNILLWQ
jgi:type 2 lantibiotic biosynthesis protein LanM